MSRPEPELIEVDGETFEVTADPDAPGQHHLTWTTGPNPGYGFTTRRSDGVYATREELVAGICTFLAQIDPETGYLD